jgi:hypothetical protein
MKNVLFSVVAAFALTLTSAAFAQATPTSDKAPPPAGSPGTATTGAPTTDAQPPKTDATKKTGKNKQGAPDTSAEKPSTTK